jgi:hypothetical protein
LGTSEAGISKRQLTVFAMALTGSVMVVPSVVVGVLTNSVVWGLLTCLLTGTLGAVGCLLALAALKDWPMARQLFKLVFGARRLRRLLLLRFPPPL